MITDAEICRLRDLLFRGPADSVQLRGLVACHDALGRSHRRLSAREHCAQLLQTIQRRRAARSR
jgi:hypothetical protein